MATRSNSGPARAMPSSAQLKVAHECVGVFACCASFRCCCFLSRNTAEEVVSKLLPFAVNQAGGLKKAQTAKLVKVFS
jgi:hypothetical protein